MPKQDKTESRNAAGHNFKPSKSSAASGIELKPESSMVDGIFD